MAARRFFVEGRHRIDDRVAIDGGDAHKILHVLRLREGESIELVDSSGATFDARLERDGAGVTATLVAERNVKGETSLTVDLAQAIPKGAKMDFVVEKATELGVRALLPFYCERTVVSDAGASKVERWRRLAKSASSQSGRSVVPEVVDPVPFAALLDRIPSYDAAILAWELADPIAPRERLPQLLDGARSVLAIVGPEGGFSRVEAEAAVERGAHALWLGSQILRAETAPLALLAMIAYVAA